MGKIVETKKRRKKGRPSLLDLQKRNLKLQQQQQQQQQRNNRNSNPNPNPNPYLNPRNPIVPRASPNPSRRFTRQNPVSDDAIDGEDEEDSDGVVREKKLKFVLRLPSNQQNQDSEFLNWDLYGSDSNAEDDGDDGAPKKKRRINVARHGSARKGEKQDSTSKTTVTNLGAQTGASIDDGPTTPLPDKKLLVFILDRVQKKDTYGVFSEPVDPEELPDYHEIVKHPMDFSTVRKKLDDDSYSCLEEFEKDVFLICSNAMQYNAPDTIYFRQARSMQELAKKNFENLRQDSDCEPEPEPEPEPKVVRRGRPPTKNQKKSLGKAFSEPAGSESFSDVALATGGEHAGWPNTYNLRKGPLSDRFGSNDASGRTSRYSEASSSSLAEHKFERNDDYPGSILKGFPWKFGKRQFVIDESRRNTYQLSHQSISGQDTSVFTTFDAEIKQLVAVGLHTELGYARSLARFAAKLGPVAWKIASKKIERALPSGVKFGPGWVEENDSPDHLPSSSTASPLTTPPQPGSSPNVSSLSSAAAPMMSSIASSIASSVVNKSAEEKRPNYPVLDSSRNQNLPIPSSTPLSAVVNRYSESAAKCVETGRSNNGSGLDMMPPPFQFNQNPTRSPTINGLSRGFSANLASQMAKAVSTAWPPGNYSSEGSSIIPQRLDMLPSNNFVHSMPAKPTESLQNSKVLQTLNGVFSSPSLNAAIVTPGPGSRVGRPPSWRGLSQPQQTDSAPPDLNLIFHSPGSPHSGARVDSHPDLALQL